MSAAHITDPSICGPLRSLCGIKRPAPAIAPNAVTAHLRGRGVVLCADCRWRWTGLAQQLALFPDVTSNDRPPVWDQVRTVVDGSDGNGSATSG